MLQEISLLSLEQVGFIVEQESGLRYWNSVGAFPGTRLEAEGVLVPLSSDPPADSPEMALKQRLSALLRGVDSLSLQHAGLVDEVLREISSSDDYRVDRQKLGASREGWLYVVVAPQGDFSHFQGFEQCRGVLTWPCHGTMG